MVRRLVGLVDDGVETVTVMPSMIAVARMVGMIGEADIG